MANKHCPSCDRTLPISEFGKNRQTPDGLMYYCRPCASAKQREYRLANPGAAAESKARYLEKLRSRNDAARKTGEAP
jgi:hypothetical protein